MANPSANDTASTSTNVRDFVRDLKAVHRVSFKDDTDAIPSPRGQMASRSHKRDSQSALKDASVENGAGDNAARLEDDPWIPKYTLCLGKSSCLLVAQEMC
jgi:hypothetical protein